MKEFACDLGMIGLGEMGRNLVLNMADHGFAVAGFDQDKSIIDSLVKGAGDRPVRGARDVEHLISLLKQPRSVLLLVPAGPVVDRVIREVVPFLQEGDLIIDGGNSHFKDTDTRILQLEKRGLLFLGVGISGGGEGARLGPSIMPGGPREGYERVSNILTAIAAKVNGNPCVSYLGPGSSGHYVKMVHNGIEYGIMRLISESYDLMKRGLQLSNDDLHRVFLEWNRTELSSYLIEITAHIFARNDPKTGRRLIDVILDVAEQKGTGKWSSQDAMDIGAAVPTIDAAVAMREMSSLKSERQKAGARFHGPVPVYQGDREAFLDHLRNALYASIVITYTQGMALLHKASDAHCYHLDLETVARIWRGGCIIRSAFLEQIRKAFKKNSRLSNLLLDDPIGAEVEKRQEGLRFVISEAVRIGIPLAGMMSALAYFDSYRSEWMPANLIQAQRDFFGAHTYERTDMEGAFHTDWT